MVTLWELWPTPTVTFPNWRLAGVATNVAGLWHWPPTHWPPPVLAQSAEVQQLPAGMQDPLHSLDTPLHG
jgi:hypothetical protein